MRHEKEISKKLMLNESGKGRKVKMRKLLGTTARSGHRQAVAVATVVRGQREVMVTAVVALLLFLQSFWRCSSSVW